MWPPGPVGVGVGKALLAELVALSEGGGLWTLQASHLPENGASSAIHKAGGFREVGLREFLGQLDGTWRDILLMERRNSVI